MKDGKNSIDELFNDGLGGFNPSPPPEVWKRIEASLPGPLPAPASSKVSGSSGKIFVGIAAAVITGLALLWFLKSNDHETGNITQFNRQTISDNPKTPINDETVNTISPEPETISATVNTAVRIEKSVAANSEPEQSAQSLPAGKPEEALPDHVSIKSLSGNPLEPKPHSLPGIPLPEAEISQNSSTIPALRSDFTIWLNSRSAKFRSLSAHAAFSPLYKASYKPLISKGKGIPFIAGVYVSFDQIDYKKGIKKQSRAAGVSLSTFKGPWTLETGAALCLSEDNGRYMINYNSYDSLGFYNKVVAFSLQEDGTIHFDTEIEGVYDSIDHRIESSTRNRYTYLQIPLMAGYRFYSNRFFTLSMKAGPLFSLMLGSDEPPVTFSQERANLRSIENLSPARLSTDWQMAASLGIGLSLSRRFSLSVEPTYKTYLRPVYRNHHIRPQSFGIRAGLLYRF